MKQEKKDDYSDIISLEHPVSKKHAHMSLYDRAAQFSPFSALTGHEAAIAETGRLTQEKMELCESKLFCSRCVKRRRGISNIPWLRKAIGWLSPEIDF